MTQSLNKPFTLHLSNVRGRKTNTSYPYEAPITCPADLMKAAKFDHTAGLFKDGKNSKGGMIAAHRAIKDFVTFIPFLMQQRNASLYSAISSLIASHLILGFNETKI